MSEEVSTLRLYLMRLLYLMNFAVLGMDMWPSIVRHGSAWAPVEGAAFSFWGALALLSGLGIRYPLVMLPLLLLQLTYKLIWLLAVALPQWPEIQASGLTQPMIVGAVLDVVVIPWPYVVTNYALKRGNRWRWGPFGNK